jgi:hypothetical protein
MHEYFEFPMESDLATALQRVGLATGDRALQLGTRLAIEMWGLALARDPALVARINTELNSWEVTL